MQISLHQSKVETPIHIHIHIYIYVYEDETLITLDQQAGGEIKQIEPSDIRKNIAYVSQDTILFNGTLKENILYKYPYENDETLIKATKTAQLMDFVNQHPSGFDLSVGERGDTLSGGQKKAISLARALVGDYTTLLLDEPTDSMDIQTEMNLIKDLKNEIKDKTVLLVTHKSSMLELVD